jgi:hypothetical protein
MRALTKQQTWTLGPFQELLFPVCMGVTKKWVDHITQGRPTNPTGLFTFEAARSETPDNLWEITFRLTNAIPERIIFVSRGITVMLTVFVTMSRVTNQCYITTWHCYLALCICTCHFISWLLLCCPFPELWCFLSYQHLIKVDRMASVRYTSFISKRVQNRTDGYRAYEEVTESDNRVFCRFTWTFFALLIVPGGWIWGIWIELFCCVDGEFEAQEETIKGTRFTCPAWYQGRLFFPTSQLTEQHLLRYIGCSKNRFATARCFAQRRTSPHWKLEPLSSVAA